VQSLLHNFSGFAQKADGLLLLYHWKNLAFALVLEVGILFSNPSRQFEAIGAEESFKCC
jgi:hypothetical protein